MATRQVDSALSGGRIGPGDMVLFSSGSTGRPRGIVRTLDSWQASVGPLSEITKITKADTVWLPGPLWSSLFLYGAFHAAAVGARVVFRDDDPAGASALHCVPSQIPGILDLAAAGGLPLLRIVVVSGDHLDGSLRQRCETVGWRVVEYYGAAELSFVAWRDTAEPFRPFPGVETEIREGMLWVRSPYLARCYLAAAAAPVAAATLSLGLQDSSRTLPRSAGLAPGPFAVDPQGWATVGDLARATVALGDLDRAAGGGLEVLGRGNTAVTSGGHTVVVEEVEHLLRGLPGVEEVAVFGMPHRRLGQVLAAVVVGPAKDDSLRAAVAAMPAPARPRRWVHADALPRSSGGKVRRDALPELVAMLSRP